jgi:hypothetical protein
MILIVKELAISNVGQDMEQLGLSCTSDRKKNCFSAFGKLWQDLPKLNM